MKDIIGDKLWGLILYMEVTKEVSWTTGKLSMPGQSLGQVIVAVLNKYKFISGGNLLRGEQLQPLFPSLSPCRWISYFFIKFGVCKLTSVW